MLLSLLLLGIAISLPIHQTSLTPLNTMSRLPVLNDMLLDFDLLNLCIPLRLVLVCVHVVAREIVSCIQIRFVLASNSRQQTRESFGDQWLDGWEGCTCDCDVDLDAGPDGAVNTVHC